MSNNRLQWLTLLHCELGNNTLLNVSNMVVLSPTYRTSLALILQSLKLGILSLKMMSANMNVLTSLWFPTRFLIPTSACHLRTVLPTAVVIPAPLNLHINHQLHCQMHQMSLFQALGRIMTAIYLSKLMQLHTMFLSLNFALAIERILFLSLFLL